MGYYLSIPVLIIAAALQSTIVPQFRFIEGQLDLVYVIVILWSVNASLEEGITWAFIGGILQDLLSYTPIGTSTFGMIIVVFIINTLRQQVYSVNIVLIVGFVIMGTIFQHIMFFVILNLTGLRFNLVDFARNAVLPTLLFNLLFTLPIYGLVRMVQRQAPQDRIGA